MHDHGIWVLRHRAAVTLREVAEAHDLAGREHEAAALERDVAHGRQPRLAVVGGGRAIDGDTLGVHGHAQHRHVVFPTDHRSHAAGRRFEYRQRGAVAIAPNQSFPGGRHQFAVLAEQGAIGIEEERRAVDGAEFALDDADDDLQSGGGSGFADPVGFRPRHVYGRIEISAELVAPSVGPDADADVVEGTFGIRRHQRLGEQKDPATVASGAGGPLFDFGDRFSVIERYGADLDDTCSDFHFGLLCSPRRENRRLTPSDTSL